MAWACTQRIPATQKIVLLMLANRTNHDTGKCIPKIKTLADDCGLSESGVKSALRSLADAGLIVAIPRFQDSVQLPNAYQLRMEVAGGRGDGGSPENPGSGAKKPRVGCDVTTEPVFEPGSEPTPNPKGEHVPEGFAKFWECYPSTRKVGKKTCLDKWRKKKLESIADTIIQHVEAMKGTRAWKDGFDPSPQTYLAQERWADGVNVQTIQDQKFAGVI